MLRRSVGRFDFDVSLLGFGCMRLPTLDDPPPDSEVGNIDEEQAIQIIRYAVDHGVDYLDTAWGYHNEKSEVLVGKAVRDGYRERVKIATKLPMWLVESREDCDLKLNEQLRRLGTDYVDMYLLHALSRETWHKVKKFDVLEFMDEAKRDGRIQYAGFSFHDELDVFKDIVDSYDWDFCQIQLNYMDEEYQAGVEGLRYAASKGLAVVIMEPLRGGKLVKNIPHEIEALFDETSIKRTPAEWAFRWVCNHPEVSVVLSGMGSLEEVQENLKTMSEAKAHSLTEEELAIIGQAKDFYNRRTKVKCTDCRYCLPCPQGVAIPRIFSMYNSASIYNSFAEGKWEYDQLVKEEHDGGQCVECGQCESVCPQHLSIIQYLKDAHEVLA